MMNPKFFETMKLCPDLIRISSIVAWGVAMFLLLTSSSALAKEHHGQEQRDFVLIKPIDLPSAARTPGNDMYLYEGNSKTYLYIEQDSGKRLTVLDVSDPERVSLAAEKELAIDVPYDFVGPIGGDSVLIRFHTKNGQECEWGRLRLGKPISPELVTWTQSSGEIIDPSDGHIVSIAGREMSGREALFTQAYQIVDFDGNEAFTLATIPGVKKSVIDTKDGRTFYLSSDGLWILRNLSAEEKYWENQLSVRS